MKTIGITIGDLHWPEIAGRGSWADLPEIRGDVEYALRRTVEMCVSAQADLYLAGDNIDGPDPEPASLAELYRTLRPIVDAKLDIYYILGNHERGRDWLAPLGHRAIRIEDAKPIHTRSGPMICGLSYQDPNVFEEQVRKVPPTDIGLYHQGFREWTGGRGFPLACLPRHRLAVVGDTHVADAIAVGGSTRLSPGPLTPQSTTEFCEYSTIWRIQENLTVEPVPLIGRKRVRYEVNTPEDADMVLDRMAQILTERNDVPVRLATPLVAIRLRTPIDGFLDVVRKLANDRGISLRISDDSRSARPRPSGPAAVGAGSLADAVSSWPAPPDVRDLALKLIAPGAKPRTVLNEDLNAQVPDS